MGLNIVLLCPRVRFNSNRWGVGFQIPLGLVFIGGPLLDAGHSVRLVDNDVLNLDDEALAAYIAADPPDCILVGHTGSLAAHPSTCRTVWALKQRLPATTIVYGGVYPSFEAQAILRENPAIDVIVRGEGEAIAVDLAAALSRDPEALRDVPGIVWRDGATIRANPLPPPIANLDAHRPGWELVNWDDYRLFGYKPSAGMQFSRGCVLTCTFCGQWSFWRRWRHRSPQNFVDELQNLKDTYGVQVVWLADEHFFADPAAARQTLELMIERDLGLSLNVNLTAASLVENPDLAPLLKQAGFDNVIMGIEALNDATIDSVRKDNSYDVSREAVRLLRENHIISLTNLIYGLHDETWRTVRQTFKRLLVLDSDIFNACYVTPLPWTRLGRETRPQQVVQPDIRRWTYRNQILETPNLRPWQLFVLVKLSEFAFHLRPRLLARTLFSPDRRYRRIMRHYYLNGLRVLLVEIGQFLFGSPLVQPGDMREMPSTRPVPLRVILPE